MDLPDAISANCYNFNYNFCLSKKINIGLSTWVCYNKLIIHNSTSTFIPYWDILGLLMKIVESNNWGCDFVIFYPVVIHFYAAMESGALNLSKLVQVI